MAAVDPRNKSEDDGGGLQKLANSIQRKQPLKRVILGLVPRIHHFPLQQGRSQQDPAKQKDRYSTQKLNAIQHIGGTTGI